MGKIREEPNKSYFIKITHSTEKNNITPQYTVIHRNTLYYTKKHQFTPRRTGTYLRKSGMPHRSPGPYRKAVPPGTGTAFRIIIK